MQSLMPVLRQPRRNGWTAERCAAFLAAIAAGCPVGGAAVIAGMSRESAYRLALRPGGAAFVAAWRVAAIQGRTAAALARAVRHRRPRGTCGSILDRQPRNAAERRDQDRAIMTRIARLDRLIDNPSAWR